MLLVVYVKVVFCHHSCLQFMLMISLNVSEGQAMAFYIGCLFCGCILYADDIVLLSGSCHGLQKLLDICGNYGIDWDKM